MDRQITDLIYKMDDRLTSLSNLVAEHTASGSSIPILSTFDSIVDIQISIMEILKKMVGWDNETLL